MCWSLLFVEAYRFPELALNKKKPQVFSNLRLFGRGGRIITTSRKSFYINKL